MERVESLYFLPTRQGGYRGEENWFFLGEMCFCKLVHTPTCHVELPQQRIPFHPLSYITACSRKSQAWWRSRNFRPLWIWNIRALIRKQKERIIRVAAEPELWPTLSYQCCQEGDWFAATFKGLTTMIIGIVGWFFVQILFYLASFEKVWCNCSRINVISGV